MPSGERKDPYKNARFIVEIDGIAQAGFSEAVIPDSTTNIIEYRSGNDLQIVRKIPGLTEHSNLILKSGITDSMELYNWHKIVKQGKIKDARRNIAIILLDEEGNPGPRWEFINAWPCKYSTPTLIAEGNDVAIESLEITFETMERVS